MKNKIKSLFTAFCIFLFHFGNAQSFQGIATYQSSTTIDFTFDSTQMSTEQMATIKKQLQERMQKEFLLTFNNTESTWKEKESLGGVPAKASSNGMEIMVMSSNENEILYKDVAKKIYERATEIMGKRFIVKDELKDYQWKLIPEYKKIGEYNCQKAIYERVVDSKRFSTGMEEMEITKDTITTVAWFTMNIPVSNGPKDYYGLPGLILELKTGRQVLICTRLEINPLKPITIEKPKKGKVVDSKTYNEIEEEKLKEMMSRYKSSGDGDEIEIVIGG